MSKDEKKLIDQLMQVVAMMHRNLGRRESFMNPHRGQGRVLSILKLKPEMTQKELIYLLDLSKQATGELLSKLENCGYITRTPSEEDKRVMMIQLTEEGRTASDKMSSDSEEEDQLFQCLSEEEKNNFSSYLDRIIAEGRKLGYAEREGMRREDFEGRRRPDPFDRERHGRYGMDHRPEPDFPGR